MAESTLSATYSEIRVEVAKMLGLNADPGGWPDGDKLNLDAVIKRGLRQFYNPPPMPPDNISHDWNFLRPVISMVLPTDSNILDLPDDFGGMLTNITYDRSHNKSQGIVMTGEGRIRQAWTQITGSGTPCMAAVRPKTCDGTTGQRYELILDRTPIQGFTIWFQYHAIPNMLSDAKAYPLGGMQHGETILESCLAIAEQNDNEGVSQVHTTKFLQMLAASITRDKETNGAAVLGYNGDNSDSHGRMPYVRRPSTFTYNGVTPQ